MVPLLELEKAFEETHPAIDVLTEGHGSIQVIRRVTELSEKAEIVAVADHVIIPMLMYTTNVPGTQEKYTSWYVKFAGNVLGIAYKRGSKYADEINSDNWYEILSRPDVRIGFADARLDSCGYRTLMVLQLAERYYNKDSILENILGQFSPRLGIDKSDTITINIPEILRPESDRVLMRGSSMRLIALLEAGEIDYFFEYRSVTEQHNFSFLALPSEINLGSEHPEWYGKVKCTMDFQRFSSIQPEFIGEPIIYGITIPRNAPVYDKAVLYIEFLLGPEGRKIFINNYQPLLTPVQADNETEVPAEIKALLK